MSIYISVKHGQGAQPGRRHRARYRPLLAAPALDPARRGSPRRHHVHLQAAAGLSHVGDTLHSTEPGQKASARFGEFCSCCCLPPLPQLASSIHSTWPKPFRRPLYLHTSPLHPSVRTSFVNVPHVLAELNLTLTKETHQFLGFC